MRLQPRLADSLPKVLFTLLPLNFMLILETTMVAGDTDPHFEQQRQRLREKAL